MTYPRLQTVDPEAPGFFHCISRCVRHAFLCGEDVYSGRSYEHRKACVEDQLLMLAECFAVGLYAYAVMSNRRPPLSVAGGRRDVALALEQGQMQSLPDTFGLPVSQPAPACHATAEA